jgi:hypothetical protein
MGIADSGRSVSIPDISQCFRMMLTSGSNHQGGGDRQGFRRLRSVWLSSYSRLRTLLHRGTGPPIWSPQLTGRKFCLCANYIWNRRQLTWCTLSIQCPQAICGMAIQPELGKPCKHLEIGRSCSEVLPVLEPREKGIGLWRYDSDSYTGDYSRRCDCTSWLCS